MADWWRTEILDTGKQPLFLCAVAFLVTFAVTRLIVRMIRAGRGPFTNNTVGGLHLHHVVPGIVLMVVWGVVALGSESVAWESVAGFGFGAGAALVLDEFALILHLDDVYWTKEGRTSLDAVFLTAGVLVLVLLGSSPVDLGNRNEGIGARLGLMVVLAIDLVAVGITFMKGKFGTGVIGFLIPVAAWFGAVRLARPTSPWAHHRYEPDSRRMRRAVARDERFERRWRSKLRRVQDAVGGSLGS